VYGTLWNIGDVVGCQVKYTTTTTTSTATTEIIYYLNGTSLGTAFTFETLMSYNAESKEYTYVLLVPAISLDGYEDIEVNFGQNSFQYPPNIEEQEFYAIKDIFIQDSDDITSSKATDVMPSVVLTQAKVVSTTVPVEVEINYSPLDLDSEKFDVLKNESALMELEALGLQYLKQELSRRGLKCGGTLKERAARLLSIRGMKEEDIDAKLKSR
jgi:hypothetical protein